MGLSLISADCSGSMPCPPGCRESDIFLAVCAIRRDNSLADQIYICSRDPTGIPGQSRSTHLSRPMAFSAPFLSTPLGIGIACISAHNPECGDPGLHVVLSSSSTTEIPSFHGCLSRDVDKVRNEFFCMYSVPSTAFSTIDSASAITLPTFLLRATHLFIAARNWRCFVSKSCCGWDH
ncbi:hypothetical protein BDZ89DRAFT_374469 [Hymenopellis radicata]|nr:hypothetical protein BDZ89DRAFT_374469 [Hymenopellis radicata]